MEEKKKYCPFKGDGSSLKCLKDTCAIWDDYSERCSILSIARELYTVAATIENLEQVIRDK